MKSKINQAFNLPQILKVKEKHEKDLLLFPNVTGVGIGYKRAKGTQKNKLCLKVYVSKKVPQKKLSKNQVIPAQLNGIPTDVEEIGNIKTHA